MITQKQIVIDGLLSSYTETGEGQPILLLHGWGCSANIFKDLQVELAKSFKVLAVNFPGFGNNEEPKTIWGVHEYAEWLEFFLLKTNIQNPIVLGHSFGGRIALIVNTYMRISKLILTGSSGLILGKKNAGIAKLIPDFLKRGIFKKIGIKFFGSDDYKNASPLMREILKKVIAEDLSSYTKHIYVPTLLVWGEKDKATPLEMGTKFKELIRNSRLEVIKNSGHYVFLEKKDEFMDIINDFIRCL
jgi:pimeloyl-ACP methyl ester carboxylesterase